MRLMSRRICGRMKDLVSDLIRSCATEQECERNERTSCWVSFSFMDFNPCELFEKKAPSKDVSKWPLSLPTHTPFNQLVIIVP